MTDVTEWVKQIITVLILVGFLDLILPDNELRGVAKLIMGLFIITLLIQPLGRILKLPDPSGIPALGYSSRENATDQVVRKGLQMRDSWLKGFTIRNQQLIKERLSAALGMIDDLRVENMDVEFQESRPIRVKVRAAPLNKPLSPAFSRQKTERVQNAVRLVTDLPAANIEVTWHAPN